MLMQQAANKIRVAMIVLLMGLLFYGCGSEDLLDENNQRYKADLSFADHGEEDILAADAIWTDDCNADGVLDDAEEFTDLYAKITITIEDATTPGIEMTGYRIRFTALRSYDYYGNAVDPPAVGSYAGAYSVVIPPLSETEFWITCMEIDLKRHIGSFLDLTSPAFPDVGFRYRVTIDMDFVDEYDEPREITVTRTIWLGAYDNC
jgi:hypothetical protein